MVAICIATPVFASSKASMSTYRYRCARNLLLFIIPCISFPFQILQQVLPAFVLEQEACVAKRRILHDLFGESRTHAYFHSIVTVCS